MCGQVRRVRGERERERERERESGYCFLIKLSLNVCEGGRERGREEESPVTSQDIVSYSQKIIEK